MGLWRRQADAARQTGLESAIQEVLTVVESGDAGGTKILGIKQSRRRVCQQYKNERIYGQMETTGRFSASNWSRSRLPRSSDCSGKWLFGGDKNSRNQANSASTLDTQRGRKSFGTIIRESTYAQSQLWDFFRRSEYA